DRYNPLTAETPDRALPNDMDYLAEFSKTNNYVDFAGRIIWKEMVDAKNETIKDKDGKPLMHEVFNFGKYKGWDVAEVLKRDPGYYSWMLSSDFTNNTKQVLTRIRLREFNKRLS
ncbi:MAG: 3'-5' exonuclease, partial [Prevotella sp.]|nr:3'-5' exonuclease [Prevotella sp.]